MKDEARERAVTRWMLASLGIFTLAILGWFVWEEATNRFVVSYGSWSRGDPPTRVWWRARHCAGAVRKNEGISHAFESWCLGIPFGTWRCWRAIEQEAPAGWLNLTVQVDCGTEHPVAPAVCEEVLYDPSTNTAGPTRPATCPSSWVVP